MTEEKFKLCDCGDDCNCGDGEEIAEDAKDEEDEEE